MIMGRSGLPDPKKEKGSRELDQSTSTSQTKKQAVQQNTETHIRHQAEREILIWAFNSKVGPWHAGGRGERTLSAREKKRF